MRRRNKVFARRDQSSFKRHCLGESDSFVKGSNHSRKRGEGCLKSVYFADEGCRGQGGVKPPLQCLDPCVFPPS